ncbi:MerR family DNA-binding transcriptional regulator [Streptomyces sp. NPDC052727]|uniref:MerR family DNA-binding transcriptional regulator n=1 Tax=Streptomyces sp. NPDC052727 TaxID=3154854 RepID=UPI00342216FF
MPIGELASATGATIRALRCYEEQGLPESERSPGGTGCTGRRRWPRVRDVRDLLASGSPWRT